MASLQTTMSSPECIVSTAKGGTDAAILPLLTTVFTSILEVFLLCLAGYILAARGILDKKTQKQINRLNVSLFTPSLLFSKVAFFLSPEKLKELWIIPIFFVLVTTVSMSVSFLLGWVFRVKRSQRNFAMAAAMFMNSNSLPIALMQSLVVTVHGLKWGPSDNKNAMVGRALTYLVLYSTLGMVLRWSYGVRLLAQSDPENEEAREEEEQTSALPHHHQPQFPSEEGTLRPNSLAYDGPSADADMAHRVQSNPRMLLRPGHARRQSRFYNSFPNSPNQSRMQLPDIDSSPASNFISSPEGTDSESDGEAEAAPLLLPRASPSEPQQLPTHAEQVPPRPQRRHTRHASTISQVPAGPAATLRRARRRLYRTWVALNQFMTAPLWAALLSLIVACVRPLQHALENHLQPIKGAVTSAGNCSIPLTLIVLGGYFYPEKSAAAPPKPTPAGVGEPMAAVSSSESASSLLESVREMFGKQKQQRAAGTARTRAGETKTVVIAVVSRMILTPMLLLPLMALSAKFNLHAILEDPVFVVANVLLVSSPPALTLAQITQAASGDAFERLISRTIFWSYCIVTPPATIVYVVIGMMLSKL